eukprot:GHVS01064101.1.p1 GENE.GHVS01064101.1~~GHVS01064101.1.p1  ORF type:complete len:771 (+),score=134.50 GHVS01064101.1:67-2313(+)
MAQSPSLMAQSSDPSPPSPFDPSPAPSVSSLLPPSSVSHIVAVEDVRVCQGCGEGCFSDLCCPSCKEADRLSFFCCQKCFKENWKEHSKLHKTIHSQKSRKTVEKKANVEGMGGRKARGRMSDSEGARGKAEGAEGGSRTRGDAWKEMGWLSGKSSFSDGGRGGQEEGGELEFLEDEDVQPRRGGDDGGGRGTIEDVKDLWGKVVSSEHAQRLANVVDGWRDFEKGKNFLGDLGGWVGAGVEEVSKLAANNDGSAVQSSRWTELRDLRTPAVLGSHTQTAAHSSGADTGGGGGERRPSGREYVRGSRWGGFVGSLKSGWGSMGFGRFVVFGCYTLGKVVVISLGSFLACCLRYGSGNTKWFSSSLSKLLVFVLVAALCLWTLQNWNRKETVVLEGPSWSEGLMDGSGGAGRMKGKFRGQRPDDRLQEELVNRQFQTVVSAPNITDSSIGIVKEVGILPGTVPFQTHQSIPSGDTPAVDNKVPHDGSSEVTAKEAVGAESSITGVTGGEQFHRKEVDDTGRSSDGDTTVKDTGDEVGGKIRDKSLTVPSGIDAVAPSGVSGRTSDILTTTDVSGGNNGDNRNVSGAGIDSREESDNNADGIAFRKELDSSNEVMADKVGGDIVSADSGIASSFTEGSTAGGHAGIIGGTSNAITAVHSGSSASVISSVDTAGAGGTIADVDRVGPDRVDSIGGEISEDAAGQHDPNMPVRQARLADVARSIVRSSSRSHLADDSQVGVVRKEKVPDEHE